MIWEQYEHVVHFGKEARKKYGLLRREDPVIIQPLNNKRLSSLNNKTPNCLDLHDLWYLLPV